MIRFYLRSKYSKIRIEGWDKVDWSKNYVLTANHRSLSDPPLIASFSRHSIAYIAKQELFEKPPLSWIIKAYGAIPVDRDKPDSSTMKRAKQILVEGEANLGIFIEGTRGETDLLGSPNVGPVFLAKVSKRPILPVGISYRRNEVLLQFGEAYELDPKLDNKELAWQCLEKISHLCDYKMPARD